MHVRIIRKWSHFSPFQSGGINGEKSKHSDGMAFQWTSIHSIHLKRYIFILFYSDSDSDSYSVSAFAKFHGVNCWHTKRRPLSFASQTTNTMQRVKFRSKNKSCRKITTKKQQSMQKQRKMRSFYEFEYYFSSLCLVTCSFVCCFRRNCGKGGERTKRIAITMEWDAWNCGWKVKEKQTLQTVTEQWKKNGNNERFIRWHFEKL